MLMCRCALALLGATATAAEWQVPAYRSALAEFELRELLGLVETSGTPLIALTHRLGLANRLRSLAAAHVFAKDTQVELVVRWKAERGCNCLSEDLFAGPPWTAFTGNTSALDGLLAMVNATQPSVVLQPATGRPVLILRTSGRLRWSLPVALEPAKYSAIILDPRGQFASPDMDCREFLHRKRAFYTDVEKASLRVAGLNETVTNLRKALADKFVVGLHVRTDDPSFDWPVVPPPDVSVAASSTWDESAPVHVHFEAARRLLKRHPRAVIFLASNDAAVKIRAKREFAGDELVYADWGGATRATPGAGQRAALADWLVLGDAAIVLHTFGSSFGEESAARTGAPSVRLRAGGHVLGTDVNRAYCGHIGFRAAASEAEEHCFEQAGASVCSPPLELRNCELEESWGLPNVFC